MRALFILCLVGCAPADVVDRAEPRTASVQHSTLHAHYRVLPPPPDCAPLEPPIVFLPALGFTGHSFAAIALHMHACRERVLVDLPGIGDEVALGKVNSAEVVEAVDDVIRSESGAPVILVGHSIGGAIATRLAARHPEHVAALVLINAAVTPFDLSWWERLALHPAVWAPALRIFGQPLLFKRVLPEVIGDTGAIDEFDLRKLAHLLGDAGDRATLLDYYRTFLTLPELERTEHALGRVQAPILVLWGRRDGVLPPSMVAAIRGAIAPTVRIDVRFYPGAAHLLPMERPEEVALALDELDARLALRGLPLRPLIQLSARGVEDLAQRGIGILVLAGLVVDDDLAARHLERDANVKAVSARTRLDQHAAAGHSAEALELEHPQADGLFEVGGRR
jgi:pimeloyl-ACP methyl ester carboxylesterase